MGEESDCSSLYKLAGQSALASIPTAATGKTRSAVITFMSCSLVRAVPNCQGDRLLSHTVAVATLFCFILKI